MIDQTWDAARRRGRPTTVGVTAAGNVIVFDFDPAPVLERGIILERAQARVLVGQILEALGDDPDN
jgi:hypothetical protein